ncbi:MAG TPA: ABC transporter permease [Candidatus Methylomirabilis sp.]|nr:ABC transporter permease [Candidatus Methylomirabilis sp.]
MDERAVEFSTIGLNARLWAAMPRGFSALVWFLRKKPLGAAGAFVIGGMLLMAIAAGLVAPYDPLATDFGAMLGPPDRAHWLGTDAFGRDVLSRLLYGARTALLVGFASSFLGATLGALIGLTSAYLGGRVDLYTQRGMDIVISFPIIVLALTVVAMLGIGTVNLILAITIPFIPRVSQVVRASALSIREMPFIEAARALGSSRRRIILRHMFPNVMASYLVMLTAFLGQAILLEASLSFLGLGTAEPSPSWGLMLRGAAVEFAERAPWMAIFPGLTISAAVFAFNVLGDALRDVLDPKLRMA